MPTEPIPTEAAEPDYRALYEREKALADELAMCLGEIHIRTTRAGFYKRGCQNLAKSNQVALTRYNAARNTNGGK